MVASSQHGIILHFRRNVLIKTYIAPISIRLFSSAIFTRVSYSLAVTDLGEPAPTPFWLAGRASQKKKTSLPPPLSLRSLSSSVQSFPFHWHLLLTRFSFIIYYFYEKGRSCSVWTSRSPERINLEKKTFDGQLSSRPHNGSEEDFESPLYIESPLYVCNSRNTSHQIV